MLFEILFVVCMLLWLLTALPFQPLQPYAPAGTILAWLSVLFLGLHVFAGGGLLR